MGPERVTMVLAFFSINGLELLVVGIVALMIFGERLPEVTMRAVAHVMRVRRLLLDMWRDTGLEEELRNVRRDVERAVPKASDFDLSTRPKAVSSIEDPRAAAKEAREKAAQAERERAALDPEGERSEPTVGGFGDEEIDDIDDLQPGLDAIADGDDWDLEGNESADAGGSPPDSGAPA